MEGKEYLTDVDLEENPETISTMEEGQDQEPSLESSEGDAPGTGRARARQHVKRTRKGKGRATRPADGKPPGTAYPFDFRLRLVKMHLEEGITVKDICAETRLSPDTVFKWLARYHTQGEAGLRTGGGKPREGRKQIPDAVKAVMVETKRTEPTWGVTRISQFMQRMLHLPGCPKTVQRTLHAEKLIVSKPPRAPKMPTKPRFFERATPNQMWQSDIFTFTLGGKNAYLIGFTDDYSRFITSLGVYRSQTAEHVLETYRRGVGEYGVPREMLTDNGRQYTNWRGKTRFEQELAKDKVHHLRSRPHHPMTLGKIERFWQNINGEFLCRAQFDSFEQAQERIALWVRHYNHRRPHQGIGGMCPADRFFEVRNDLRKVIERGIEDNLLEIALRGRPQRPFYMVGRVDGQSVVMQASKGKLVMTVGDKENNQQQEVLCDLENRKVEVKDETGKNDNPGNGEKDQEHAAEPVHGGGEMPGGAGPVDRTQLGFGSVQGAGDNLEHAELVAGTGDGRDDAGTGTETLGSVREHAAEPAPAGTAGAEGCQEGNGRPGQPAADPEAGAAAEVPSSPASTAAVIPAVTGVPAQPELTPELVARVLQQLLAGSLPAGYVARLGAVITAPGGNHAGNTPASVSGLESRAPYPAAAGRAGREDHGDPGRRDPGCLPQGLARVAEPRPLLNDRSNAGPPDRASAPTGGRGEIPASGAGSATGAAGRGAGTLETRPEPAQGATAAGTRRGQ